MIRRKVWIFVDAVEVCELNNVLSTTSVFVCIMEHVLMRCLDSTFRELRICSEKVDLSHTS